MNMTEEEAVAGSEGREAMEDHSEIQEASPLIQPDTTLSEIVNDPLDLLPERVIIAQETDEDIEVREDSDGRLAADPTADIEAPEETHDLKALATTGNNMSDRNKRQPSSCYVDVVGPDGVIKRFAKGTKASFAVERFNRQLKDPALPVVCIVACKEGEAPIEFGPDVELVLYDVSWTLKTLREAVVPISSTKPVMEAQIDKLKDTIKEGTARAFSSLRPSPDVPWTPIGLEATKIKQNQSTATPPKKLEDMDPMHYFGVKNWEDLYPGGKLPEGGIQDCSPAYVGKVALMFFFVFAFAGGLSYMLERMPEPTGRFY